MSVATAEYQYAKCYFPNAFVANVVAPCVDRDSATARSILRRDQATQ